MLRAKHVPTKALTAKCVAYRAQGLADRVDIYAHERAAWRVVCLQHLLEQLALRHPSVPVVNEESEYSKGRWRQLDGVPVNGDHPSVVVDSHWDRPDTRPDAARVA